MGSGAAVALGILTWAIFRLDEQPKPAPDSAYYMAEPYTVPEPFCFRWLVPLLARRNADVWVFCTFLGVVLQSWAMWKLSGTLVASLLLLALPGGARFSVRHPVLVDCYALGAALCVAATIQESSPVATWAWCLVLGGMREQAPLLVALLTGRPELALTALPGPIIGWFWFRRPARLQTDNAFIVHPWRTVAAYRRGHWLSAWAMLAPWGVVLPLAMMTGPWTFQTWAAFCLAVLPALRASDVGRVLMWGAPVLILLALQAPVPPAVWPLVLLAHCLNPYRGG